MQSHSTIFNLLLVAFFLVSIKAAPHSSSENELQSIRAVPRSGNRNTGPSITGLLPEVLRRSERLMGKDANTPVHTTTKTRRMVYGWGSRGFDEKGDGEGSRQTDLTLLSANPAETSGHISKVTKQSAPSSPTKPKTNSTVAPPAEVIKTLCHYLISSNSSDKSTGNLSPHGKDLDGKWNSSTTVPPKKNSGITTDALASPSGNTTESGAKHNPTNGKGEKYNRAMSWCYQYITYSSNNTGAHSGSIAGQKATTSANGTTLVPSKASDDSSAFGSEKSPPIVSGHSVDTESSPVDKDVSVNKPTTKKNFKIPLNFKLPSF